MKSVEEILATWEFYNKNSMERDEIGGVGYWTVTDLTLLKLVREARKEALEEVKELFTPVNSIGIDDRNNLLFDQASIIRLIDSLFTLKEKK